jgi:hypothetical protein
VSQSPAASTLDRRYIEVDGVWKRRRSGPVASIAGITCFRGHPLSSNAWFNEDGQIACNVPMRGKRRCDASLYLLLMTPTTGGHLIYVADVTALEFQDLKQRGLTVLDRLELLGATFPIDGPVAPMQTET